MPPLASLIIPQHNQSHLTRDCLVSVNRHESAPIEVIVVDDGSEPEHHARIESLGIPHTRVIAQVHTGVSAAWNRGAAAAIAPFLIFLNNDALLHRPAVNHLITPLRAGNSLLTGAALRRETALPQSILQSLPTDDFLEGWCFATTRKDFETVGGFDESMSLYFSDTDFQARLLRENNADSSALTPIANLPIRHRAHQTTRRLVTRRRIWQTDRETFIQKWSKPAN